MKIAMNMQMDELQLQPMGVESFAYVIQVQQTGKTTADIRGTLNNNDIPGTKKEMSMSRVIGGV
jgi:hypothetical protein